MADPLRDESTYDLLGGALCLDFANTVSWRRGAQPRERLTCYADLLVWAQQAGTLTEPEAHRLAARSGRTPAESVAVLRRAVALREGIHRIFSAVAAHRPPSAADLSTLNTALAGALRHARIVPTTDGFTWGWSGGDAALDRVLWPVARSAGELLTSDELSRVRECAGTNCGWLFIDTSRARSRQWCDMKVCGNRAKVRRHYERMRRATA